MTDANTPLYKMRFEMQIAEHVTNGLNAKEVGEKMGVTEFTVRRVCKKHGVKVEQPKARKPLNEGNKLLEHSSAGSSLERVGRARPDPIQAAKEALIDSYLIRAHAPILDIRADGFYLRGKLANLSDVMRETNRHRIGWNMEQIAPNPMWAV